MAAEIAKLGLRSTAFSPLNRFDRSTFSKSGRTGKPFNVRLFALPPSVVDEQQFSFTEPEQVLLERLLGIQGRGRKASPQQLKDVEGAVKTLEETKGVPDPTSSSLIEGRWQLMFTTRPGTASPIQRTFVGVDFFNIFQEVYLRTDDPRVSNIVKFSDAVGELKVEAAASVKDGKRILFRFDRAAFSFKFLPFKVPYPVPFRLLGDEAKGWLDTTYLSHTGSIRISRGNKGTTFVLQKITEPRQRLLSAISTGTGVQEAIDELISLNPIGDKGQPEALVGEWQLLWSSRLEAEGLFDVAAYGLEGVQIFGRNGQAEHLVDVLPGFGLRSTGNIVCRGIHAADFKLLSQSIRVSYMIPPCDVAYQRPYPWLKASLFSHTGGRIANEKPSNGNAYIVTMDETAFLFGGKFLLPVEFSCQFNLELLYIDNKIRISRNSRQIIFVHLRASEPKMP